VDAATCNGPYAGAWSKTMIGFGPERENFALELTYNYGIDGYDFGNDLQYIALSVPDAKAKADLLGYAYTEDPANGSLLIHGPDSYK
jgi:lactoylglutathione lyase